MNGKLVKVTTMGDEFEAFIPSPIPNKLPIDKKLSQQLEKAEKSLAKLNVATELVKGEEWFIYGFVRKEALITSQIEGTQATLTDLLETNESSPDNPDLEEVCNYLNALNYTWEQMSSEKGLPLSIRLLKASHKLLMDGVRGANKNPGEIRKTQNWIGSHKPQTAIFVPPPPEKVQSLLDDLEKFMHSESSLHPILKISMAHVQFETIHPFLDGNGRVGRLLIALMMKEYGYLNSPLLYLSLFFKKHKNIYYDLLNKVRTNSSWSEWNEFFIDGIIEISENVVATAKSLNERIVNDRSKLLEAEDVTVNAIRLFELLPTSPIITPTEAVEKLSLSMPPVSKALNVLEKLGIVEEMTGKRKGRKYHYKLYLDILAPGTEL